jgi:hypothetical protein
LIHSFEDVGAVVFLEIADFRETLTVATDNRDGFGGFLIYSGELVEVAFLEPKMIFFVVDFLKLS